MGVRLIEICMFSHAISLLRKLRLLSLKEATHPSQDIVYFSLIMGLVLFVYAVIGTQVCVLFDRISA